MKIERRKLPISELRVEQKDDSRKIVGYAAVFNSLSEDLGGFREKIAPGAFKRSLENGADVRALLNHDSNYVLGRNKSGTLFLSEDERGLKIEITPPDTQWARDLMVSMERGDIDQMSFGFYTISDDWETKDGENIRTLKEVELFDVSVVTYPAYTATSANVRSAEEVYRDFAKSLQEKDLANKQRMQERSLELKKKKIKLLEVECYE
jgi:uncharacterized protein